MRLINEDDVLKIIERVTNEAVEKNQRKYLIQPRIIAEIAGLPTIEAAPVKYGHWEYRGRDTDGRLIYKCSECGYTAIMYACPLRQVRFTKCTYQPKTPMKVMLFIISTLKHWGSTQGLKTEKAILFLKGISYTLIMTLVW